MSGVKYLKFCIICNNKFWTLKCNSVYCTKKCANRARYMPKKLLAKLIQKHSEYAIETEDIGKTSNSIVGATKGKPIIDSDISLAIAAAKELAIKRGLTIPTDTEIQQRIEDSKIKLLDMEDIPQQTHKGIRRLG